MARCARYVSNLSASRAIQITVFAPCVPRGPSRMIRGNVNNVTPWGFVSVVTVLVPANCANPGTASISLQIPVLHAETLSMAVRHVMSCSA